MKNSVRRCFSVRYASGIKSREPSPPWPITRRNHTQPVYLVYRNLIDGISQGIRTLNSVQFQDHYDDSRFAYLTLFSSKKKTVYLFSFRPSSRWRFCFFRALIHSFLRPPYIYIYILSFYIRASRTPTTGSSSCGRRTTGWSARSCKACMTRG